MYFATNIADFLACRHIATLNRREAAGEVKPAYYDDPGLELLKALGLEHEQKYLKELRARGLKVVEISTDDLWEKAAAETKAAMVQGADAIYQATFLQLHRTEDRPGSEDLAWTEDLAGSGDLKGGKGQAAQQKAKGQWGGRADFLIRVDTPSELGPWSYEVVETKLAQSTKARALIQLCFYSELVAAIQGVEPEKMHVVLGRGAEPETFQVQRYLAYFRKIKRDFQESLRGESDTYPEPVEHCFVCDWSQICDGQWRVDDHLSLVAGIARTQRKALVEMGVNTLAQLGRLVVDGKAGGKAEAGIAGVCGISETSLTGDRQAGTPDVSDTGLSRDKQAGTPAVPAQRTASTSSRIRLTGAPLWRVREQARVQLRGREEKRPVHELIQPIEEEIGLAALPLPSPCDLFLDFEGDPFAFEQGLEYLFGTVKIGDHGAPEYDELWAFDPASEKRAFTSFIERVKELRRRYPEMHIYHFAAYEQTAIKHLAGRHGVCADDVDELLRAEVFVDLHRVVRQALRASVESYSIKKLEPFYDFERSVPLRHATAALQTFESVMALGDDPANAHEVLRTIADYNRDDCMSTLRLREWLEGLRSEYEGASGVELPRREVKSGAPNEELAQKRTETTEIKERLLSGLPENEGEWTGEQRARWLLAQMLEWHRREDKSMWWEYFRLCDLSDDELLEDRNAIGGLIYKRVVGTEKKSEIHRYEFPPQDYAIDRARELHDPKTRKPAGTLGAINEHEHTLDLKRGVRSEVPHPKALVPFDGINNDVLENSLKRLGRYVADHGVADPGAHQAARDVLLKLSPRLSDGQSVETITEGLETLEAAKRLALALDSSILPIQGPPGSGKTFTAAHMIVALVDAGKKVGITAGSHKVISNLLTNVCEVARKCKVELKVVQKPNNGDGCKHALVDHVDSNGEVLEKLESGEAQVGAGTSWLWSREEFANSVDVLFVDEAGQMSLANVLAISQAASSVVLLGDPQQLDQPQKGVHPPGAEVSALAHMLGEHATIEAGQGLFLAETWRLHPDICSFTSELFYEGRLSAREENGRQRLNAKGMLGGTGLRFLSVEHSGNQNESPEEVECVVALVDQLLSNRVTWTDKKGMTRDLQLKDILIVAPYNAQVRALAEGLPEDARVGTVDKFQGQEAPVVVYSMATSTPEDAPRGMEFLYSLNRLNVATSRAQCVTVLVASPALFDVSCKTPRQMELANAFCRYLEMAKAI